MLFLETVKLQQHEILYDTFSSQKGAYYSQCLNTAHLFQLYLSVSQSTVCERKTC